ncbi:hypothetical protein D770_22200 [Flammeovirgaceae bacterium 311]|nr:hypothetical protein D770_22200 [Flammeovirgaceae bacterium 311]
MFSACEGEDPELDDEVNECLEINQTSNTGYSYDKIYDGHRLMEQRTLFNGELLNYHIFDYGPEDHIIESELIDLRSGADYAPSRITYNSNGKWVENRAIYSTENWVSVAEYDSQNQIKEYRFITEKDGTETVNYTVTYEWVGGNNTVRTFTSPTQRSVTRYEYDLQRDNLRREALENISFLTNVIAHNKNMRKRTVAASTDLASNITTETVTDYEYEYNEAGYPTKVTVTNTMGTATPAVSVTNFSYSCN